jgi:thymidylate kinase
VLIILEGPDRSGKSTVARALADRLKKFDPNCSVDMLHRGPPRRHPLAEYEQDIQDYRPQLWPGQLGDLPRRHVICDRWHLGEVVYPPVRGRGSLLTHEALWHIELFLQARGALVVTFDVPTDVLVRRTEKETGQPVGDAERRVIDRVRARFFTATVNSRVTTLRFAPSDLVDTSFVVDRVVQLASTVEAYSAPVRDFVTYVGHPSPSILVLGDVRKRANDDPGGPAFVPYGGTSGAYLLRALGEATRDQRVGRLGLANACDVDDPLDLWEMLGRPWRVTLLGRNAALAVERKFRDLGVSVGVVDHPQYVRRFHHDRVNEYGHAILSSRSSSFAGVQ